MNIFGWTFLVVSWSLIIGLCVFCFHRVLIEKEEDL